MARFIIVALALASLSACDQVEELFGEVTAKGGETDVPAEARDTLDEETVKQLRSRISGQNFN